VIIGRSLGFKEEPWLSGEERSGEGRRGEERAVP